MNKVRLPPLQEFQYTLSGVALVCEVEYEAAAPETGWPENATLWTAKTASGDDVVGILSDEQKAEIEVAFLNQKEEY